VVLYVLTVVLGGGLPLLASWLGLPWEQPFGQGSALDFIVSILTLHRTYYLADIILTYVLLFSCAALAIALVSEGYTSVVLVGSWAIWLGWQLWPQFSQLPWDIQNDAVFHFSSWQLLFFNALVIGAHRRAFASQLARIPRWVYGVGSALLFAGCIALYRSQLAVFKVMLPRVSTQQLANVLFSKADVRIGRLIVFAITATFAFTLVTQLWKPLFSLLGWLFVPLGGWCFWVAAGDHV